MGDHMAGKAEAQHLLAVFVADPLPDPKKGVEDDGVAGFLQGFANRGGLDRFVRIEVAGRLVLGELAENLLLDDEEAIAARDHASHRDTGAPNVFGLGE